MKKLIAIIGLLVTNTSSGQENHQSFAVIKISYSNEKEKYTEHEDYTSYCIIALKNLDNLVLDSTFKDYPSAIYQLTKNGAYYAQESTDLNVY